MRCVMNVKILTTRYKTPSFIKLIGSILFIAVVVLMIAMPVFELIPQGQYRRRDLHVRNLHRLYNDAA